MMVGATLSAADLVQALRLRRELSTLLNGEVLNVHDAMITANGMTAAPRFDTFDPEVPPKTTLQTMPFNVTGTFSDVGGLSALTVNGKPATISGNTFTSTIDELCDGPFPINVVATDKPARSTVVSLNVSVAIATRTNPCVSNIGPAVGVGYFVVDPNDPNTILALGGPTQVMKTTNGGATWASVATGLSTNIPAVAIARNTSAAIAAMRLLPSTNP